MMNKRDSGTAMFLMEMIAVVCFFILCAGVCILTFVKADRLSCLARDTNYASLAAESVAEIWKAQEEEGLESRFLMSKDRDRPDKRGADGRGSDPDPASGGWGRII